MVQGVLGALAFPSQYPVEISSVLLQYTFIKRKKYIY